MHFSAQQGFSLEGNDKFTFLCVNSLSLLFLDVIITLQNLTGPIQCLLELALDISSLQEVFEKLFSPYGSESDRSFIYLKTFHRARVTFANEEYAKEAKKYLHGQYFLGYELGIFLVQVTIYTSKSDGHAALPYHIL